MIKKYYDIEKSKRKGIHLFSKKQDHYILWLNTITPHGIGCYKKFEGTKYECEKYAKQNKIDLKKVIEVKNKVSEN